ncbi:MAG: hypothetical protein GX575_18560 [Candidatus Anammoximicrobium sp.]|nr:hypothetical protein [Candidatus Anammoximicrobium sp.]
MFPQLFNPIRKSLQFASVALGLALLGLAGCTSLGPQPPIEPADPEPSVGESFRKPGPPGQMLGIDDRAREIERNLGVR